MKEDCDCSYCKEKVDEYFCISCLHNFNECESNFQFDGVTYCPKCVTKEDVEKMRSRSWLSQFRDAWYVENLLRTKHLENLDEEFPNKGLGSAE